MSGLDDKKSYTAVIGGAGFVGLAITEQLLLAGEPVLVFDTIDMPADAARLLTPIGPSLRVFRGSICDRPVVQSALSTSPIKRIINCAALTPSIAQEKQSPQEIFRVNLLGVMNLLEEARDRGLPFMQVSSSGAFGEIQLRQSFDASTIAEDVLKDPISLYGISKSTAEQVTLRYGDLFDVDVLVARVGVVYGPWEHATGARHIFSAQLQILRHAMNNARVLLERDSTKDFIYSRDVGRGIVALCRASNLRSKVFHISGTDAWKLSLYAEKLRDHFPEFKYGVATGEQTPNVKLSRAKDRVPLDTRRIEQEAGFLPAFTLDSAVADYVQWARTTTCWIA